MKKIFKNTILALFNPLSPIVTLIIGWVLSILVTEPNDRFPQFVNYMIENPYVVIVFVVLWLIFTIIYTEMKNRIDRLEKISEKRREIIEEKDRQLRHTSGIVLSRSGDFANFNRLLRFNEVLRAFTENNTIVECVQMYRYSTKRVYNKINIKVTYDSGFCSDGIDINNLAQCHYDIDYNDYNTLKDIIEIWKKLSSDTHLPYSEQDSLIRILVNGIKKIYNKYFHELRDVEDISKVTNIHFTEYRIMTLLSRIARRLTTTMFDKSKLLGKDKEELEDYLLNGKRTGILNSILLEEIFMFKYTRNSHKKGGRAYVSFPLNISLDNYICVFSIQVSDLDRNIDLEYEIKSLRKDIIRRFEKTSIHF